MNIETYSLISDNYQYNSISNIQVLKDYPIIPIEYDYLLNIQTIDRLSNTVNIYLNKEEILEKLVEPLRLSINSEEPIEVEFYNHIKPEDAIYYKFLNLLHNSLIYKIAYTFGVDMEYRFKFYREDDRFIVIKGQAIIHSKLFKFKPAEIQPNPIILSLNENRKLIKLLKNI